jgi:hypothetical protein
VGQLADFYNSVIKLKFNGGLKSIYPNAVQFKNTDQLFFSYAGACEQGTDCTYDISLTINDVLQNLENSKGKIECYLSGDFGGDNEEDNKKGLIAYYADYIGFKVENKNTPIEKPLSFEQPEINAGLKTDEKITEIYLLVPEEKMLLLTSDSYIFDAYTIYDKENPGLYTKLKPLVFKNQSVAKNGKVYFVYGVSDDWVKTLYRNDLLRVCLSENKNYNSVVLNDNNVPIGVGGNQSCVVVNLHATDSKISGTGDVDYTKSITQTLDAATLAEMNNILNSVNFNNFDLTSMFNDIDLSSTFNNNIDLSSAFNNNFDLSSGFNNDSLNNFDFSSAWNNDSLNNFDFSSAWNNDSLNNFDFSSGFNNDSLNNFDFSSGFNNDSLNNFDFSNTFNSSGFDTSFDLNSFDFSGFGF